MKIKIIGLAVIVCVAGTLSAGCGKTSEQKVEIVKENARTPNDRGRTLKLSILRNGKHSCESLTGQSTQMKRGSMPFKENMEKAGSKVSAKYSKNVAALEQKNRDMKKKLKEYKDEGPVKWEEFKTNFKHDMDGMEKTMTDLFKDSA